jgi:hypothetical protein
MSGHGHSKDQSATQTLPLKSTHKPSVKFEPEDDEKYPITNGFYLNREFAEKKLGVKNLDKAKAVEVTVRVVT